MRLHIEQSDPHTQLVRVVGDLEGHEAHMLTAVYEQTDPPPLRRVIDLTEMPFVDSVGMNALLSLARATRRAGGVLVVVLQSDSYVRRLLEVRGVLDSFNVVETLEEAYG